MSEFHQEEWKSSLFFIMVIYLDYGGAFGIGLDLYCRVANGLTKKRSY